MDVAAHRFRTSASAAARRERAVFWLFRAATYLVVGCGLAVLLTIFFRGAGTVFQAKPPFLNTTFLTAAPETLYIFDYEGAHREMGFREYQAFKAAHPDAKLAPETYIYSAGGIFPAIVGTVLLVAGSMTIALLLGVSAAIYLNEYARDGRFIRFVRLSIMNLAGVPSIVFGLFGYGLFVVGFKLFGIQFFGWNTSLIAGWFTLAFMVLPVIITASEESLKAVPKGFREGSLALGATRWQTIRKNVLPYALPGILTSSILGIARVAGETAPIMFTAAYVMRDKLPWQVERISDFVLQGVMALPYHIYVVSSKIPQNEYTARVQYGTTFVFLVIVALIAAVSIVLRNRLRNRYKW
jgi:phosphate transport system permease protein